MRSLLLQIGNNHNAVLTNGRATPDEVSIAMLGLNKLMRGLVDKFQKTLKLNSETDAKWREEIVETSKRRLKLERTEEKRRKRKELKEQKAQQRNRDEWLKQNKPDGGQETEEDPVLEESTHCFENSAGTCVVTKMQKSTIPEYNSVQVQQSEKPTKKTNNKERLQKTVENKIKKVNSIKLESENLERDISRKPKKAKEAEFEVDKPKLQREISRSAKKAKEALKERRESEYDLKKPNEDVKERPTHVIDPFFITESGQPYLSTAVVLSDDDNNDTEDEQPEQKRRKSAIRGQNIKEHKDVRENNNRYSVNFVKNPSTVQSNRKIKFDEDGSAEDVPTVPKAVQDAEGMHPSWVAKQKLKPKIAAFQGTKIKFDDDD